MNSVNKKTKLCIILLGIFIISVLMGAYIMNSIIPLKNLNYIADQSTPNLYCSYNGDSKKIVFKYSDSKNMVLEFNLLGINKITHLKSVKFIDNTADIPLDNIENPIDYISLSTDWVSPYGILSKHNIINPNGSFIVGGNHGTENGLGFSTARSIDTKIYADNILLEDNMSTYCNVVTIVTQNYISSSNALDLSDGTKRDCALETVTYTITQNNIKVEVELKALEDIIITKFAGLQGTTKNTFNKITFNENNIPKTYDIVPSSKDMISSITKVEGTMNSFILSNDTDTLECYMDRTVGIGNLEYLDNNSPIAYLAPNRKVYMHNINGKNLDLNAGSSFKYSGGYIFKPNN